MIYGWILLAVLIIWGLWEYSLLYNEVKEWAVKQYTKIWDAETEIHIIEGQLALDDDNLRLFDLDRKELEEERKELIAKIEVWKQEQYVRKTEGEDE